MICLSHTDITLHEESEIIPEFLEIKKQNTCQILH